MRIVVLTSCTAKKAAWSPKALTPADFQRGAGHVARREEDLPLLPAEDLYTGQQHVRLMRGVRAFRTARATARLDLHVLSAGYGLVSAARPLAPYECTFQGMGRAELRSWADALGVPAAVRAALAAPYDLALVLLGDPYLAAAALDGGVRLGGPTLLFTSPNASRRLPALPALRVVPLSNADARQFSVGLVALKGELAARVLGGVAVDVALVDRLVGPDSIGTLLESQEAAAWSLSVVPTSAAQPRRFAAANPRVDHVVELPEGWLARPRRLRYFIPEWDDHVDPDYDFERDNHAGGQGDWSNETYAHQLYPSPSYDGLLVSKVVAEKSAKKRERINRLGVHRFLRVPRAFPVMGDCGAFGYIKEDTPPYTTGEILDYYTRLDFDYGVSVDHLIVSSTASQRQTRYDLTVQNAEDFIREHRARGLPWTPVGAVQGWSPASYADAAARLARMGYDYLGLGGLVRTNTAELLRIVTAVRERVPASTRLHLFGIARLRAMDAFADLGVVSVDSASALRRAWLGSNDNYWTLGGEQYAAVRIPEAGKSFRAKRIVGEARATAEAVERLEAASIGAVRAFARGEATVEAVLDTLDEFDHLITPDRPGMRESYRATLEDRPWERCPCEICRAAGVEVVIFRGNNRNRRRGFHNTWVFYRLLQRALEGEGLPELRKVRRGRSAQLALF